VEKTPLALYSPWKSCRQVVQPRPSNHEGLMYRQNFLAAWLVKSCEHEFVSTGAKSFNEGSAT
jgi:hypothetical protein